MYIIIDTSAIIAVIGNEQGKEEIIYKTEGMSLYAPPSVHWEIGNAFSAMLRRSRTNLQTATGALEIYRQIPIKYIDVSLSKSLEISDKFNIYAYDAYLIQCALQPTSPLITLDKGLKGVANQLGINTL